MANRTKQYLQQEFRDGERPSGTDFSDVFDSFIHKSQDGVTFDGSGNVGLQTGLTIGNSSRETGGTMRFDGTKFEFYNGTAWQTLGSGGAFAPVGGTPNVAYNGGNVGVGTGVTPPTYKFEVALTANAGAATQARFGNGVFFNGAAPFLTYTYFSHQNRANNNEFALRQGPNGNVNLNAPTGQPIILSQNSTSARLGVTTDGIVVIGGAGAPTADTAMTLQVIGNAYKTVGGTSWTTVSDKRIKKSVKPFTDSLDMLLKVNPVQFKYNGKAFTTDDEDGIGIIAQDMEKVFPYMIGKTRAKMKADDTEDSELLTFDPSALIFVVINAIKELTERLEKLEKKSK